MLRRALHTLALAALVGGALPCAAAAQVVRGIVLENGTRKPIANAQVTLTMERQEPVLATTDDDGIFLLRAPVGGDFVVTASHVGYQESSAPVTAAAGETVVVEIRMGAAAIPLEPLVVTAQSRARRGGFYERMTAGAFGSFLTRPEIEQRATSNVTDLLRVVPGLRIVAVSRRRGSMPVNLIATRGTSVTQCEPSLFIDGAPVRQGPDLPLDEILRPDMLEGVEVYASLGSVPGQFSESGKCGAVVFWTRSGDRENGRPLSWRRIIAAGGTLLVILLLTR